MAFSNEYNLFLAGNYGKNYPEQHAKIKPSIIALSKDFKIEKEIYLTSVLEKSINLQGVAYDSKENIIWFTDSALVYGYDLEEEKICKVIEDEMYVKPNGVAYDENDDTVWVLYFDSNMVEYNKNGKKLREIECGYKAQDQITIHDDTIYMTVGADYNGEENYLMELDKDGQIAAKYRLMDSYAVEGCCILDGYLYILNDGYYHSAKINKNIVQVYKFE